MLRTKNFFRIIRLNNLIYEALNAELSTSDAHQIMLNQIGSFVLSWDKKFLANSINMKEMF